MKYHFIFIISLIVYLLIFITLGTSTSIEYVSLTPAIGKVRISIFDSLCEPIEMATICVMETHEYYTTGKLGECELVLPAKKTNKFSNGPNWTEYTLIITKNGFIPHILYGLKAQANITRTGIVVTMKELSPYTLETFTQSYDFPTSIYSTNIINQNKK